MSSLSEKMISEFVESTTPAKKERSHEFTINGTVTSVDHNGVANVMLDGGDETPCQTTVGCSAGDRVIVSFKNREPVVTSNISKPTATLEEVNAKVVNAVNVFAENGTFSGTLSAAKGIFNGKVTISWEDTVPVPTSHVEVCTITFGNSSRYPIEITNQDKGSYVKSHTFMTASGLVTSSLNSGGETTASSQLNPWLLQVGTTSNYTQISSGGGVVVRNGTADTFAVQSDLRSVVTYQRTKQGVSLGGGAKTWITPTPPSDSNFNWFLLSCSSHNSIWVLHLSYTGAFLYNSSSSTITHNDTSWYWLGIHK